MRNEKWTIVGHFILVSQCLTIWDCYSIASILWRSNRPRPWPRQRPFVRWLFVTGAWQRTTIEHWEAGGCFWLRDKLAKCTDAAALLQFHATDRRSYGRRGCLLLGQVACQWTMKNCVPQWIMEVFRSKNNNCYRQSRVSSIVVCSSSLRTNEREIDGKGKRRQIGEDKEQVRCSRTVFVIYCRGNIISGL